VAEIPYVSPIGDFISKLVDTPHDFVKRPWSAASRYRLFTGETSMVSGGG